MSELDASDKELLQRAYAKLSAANEVLSFLSDYFRDKYKLTSTNQITPNGEIVNSQPDMFGNLENAINGFSTQDAIRGIPIE